MEKIVSPSALSIDFVNLTTQLKKIEVAGAKWLHYDVMDVHLMIASPQKYFDAFIESGADSITFHVECFEHVEEGLEAIKELKSKGCKAGITLRPGTDLNTIVPYLKYVDLILVMSVEPGFGGQAFIPEMVDRIAQLNQMRNLNDYQYLISVDGGINDRTGLQCRNAGADVLVAGSYVFGEDIEKAVSSLL